MAPFFDQDHARLRARIREWAEKNLIRADDGSVGLDDRAVQLARDLGAAGFLQYTVPAEFGGVRKAVQARDLCILREELARGDALADTMLAMQALGSYPIAFAGNESQKRRYLRCKPELRGEITVLRLTAPNALSPTPASQIFTSSLHPPNRSGKPRA
jgi:acyl-CoA dehydrogenase